MSETTRLQQFVKDTTAFWHRHKPRPGSSAVLVGGLIGSASTTTEIIDRGIKGEPMNMWYAVKFLFFFLLACCQSWRLWHDQPPAARTQGIDPEGHLK